MFAAVCPRDHYHVCKLNGIHSYGRHIYYNYIAVDGDNSTGTPYKTAIYSAHMYSLVHDYSIGRTLHVKEFKTQFKVYITHEYKSVHKVIHV